MQQEKKEQIRYAPLATFLPDAENARTVMDEEKLAELTESIKANGIIEPLIVRAADQPDKLRVVCGHRRLAAAEKAGLKEVPYIERELTDDEAETLQLHENLHREDLNPVDEAAAYAKLRDRGATIAEICARSGKSEAYVTLRMKLDSLIPELKDDVRKGYLPLTYANPLSAFSVEAQEAVIKELYKGYWVNPNTGEEIDENDEPEYYEEEDEDGNEIIVDAEGNKVEVDENGNPKKEDSGVEPVWYVDKTQRDMTINELSRWLQNSFMQDLSRATFDLKATNLRDDKLACVNCPMRTGAHAGLFEQSERDLCLDRSCFQAKGERFLQIARAKVAKKHGVKAVDVPIISNDWANRTNLPEGYIYENNLVMLDFEGEQDEDGEWLEAPDEHCEFEQFAIDRNGDEAVICQRASGCKLHHWSNRQEVGEGSSGPTDEQRAEAEAKKKRARKEELWDVKVGEAVRAVILEKAAAAFAEGVAKCGDSVLLNAIPHIVARMWDREEDIHRRRVILPIIEKFETMPSFERSWNQAEQTYYYPKGGPSDWIKSLPVPKQAAILFMFIHGATAAMLWNQYKDQTAVRELAREWGINYALVDAEQRVALSPKKHEKLHKAYLQQVETNDPDARIPRVYEPDYIAPGTTQPERKPEPEKAPEEAVDDEAEMNASERLQKHVADTEPIHTDQPRGGKTVIFEVDQDLYDKLYNSIEPSAATRSIPVKVFEVEGHPYYADSWTSPPVGEGAEYVGLVPLVPIHRYKGAVTKPEEWEKRGLGNHAGTFVTSESNQLYAVRDDNEYRAVIANSGTGECQNCGVYLDSLGECPAGCSPTEAEPSEPEPEYIDPVTLEPVAIPKAGDLVVAPSSLGDSGVPQIVGLTQNELYDCWNAIAPNALFDNLARVTVFNLHGALYFPHQYVSGANKRDDHTVLIPVVRLRDFEGSVRKPGDRPEDEKTIVGVTVVDTKGEHFVISSDRLIQGYCREDATESEEGGIEDVEAKLSAIFDEELGKAA